MIGGRGVVYSDDDYNTATTTTTTTTAEALSGKVGQSIERAGRRRRLYGERVSRGAL